MQKPKGEKPSDHKVAIIIGTSADDPVREIAKEVARRDKFLHVEVSELTKAIRLLQKSPLLGSAKTFILLSSEAVIDSSMEQSIARLCALREGRTQILIYALEIELSGKLALDCIKAGACDYLLRGSYDTRHLQQLEEHIVWAIQQETPYPPYNHLPLVEKNSYAFIVTPFGPLPARNDYIYGIVMALNSLEVSHRRADEVRHTMSQLSSVCMQIDQSGLIIANISQYGLSANANVYFEIGYAMARRKEVPVILIRRAGEKRAPSNINGIQVLDYTNSADLALKLHFGLKPLIEAGWTSNDT
jgi:hypothetical protein